MDLGAKRCGSRRMQGWFQARVGFDLDKPRDVARIYRLLAIVWD